MQNSIADRSRPAATRAPLDRWFDALVDEAGRADRVEANAVGDLAGDGAHVGADRRDVDGDVGVLDRTGIEQRHHQAEVVALALEPQRFAGLPGPPHRPDRADRVAHPRRRRVPLHPEPSPDMPSDLSAETEREPAAREVLQRPRRHRGDGRASRERHRHRRREPDAGGASMRRGRAAGTDPTSSPRRARCRARAPPPARRPPRTPPGRAVRPAHGAPGRACRGAATTRSSRTGSPRPSRRRAR